MSGGEFNYIQHRLDDVSVDIDRIAERSKKHINDSTYSKLKLAATFAEITAMMITRVDWYESGDDGEETFNERWDKEVSTFFDKAGKTIKSLFGDES